MKHAILLQTIHNTLKREIPALGMLMRLPITRIQNNPMFFVKTILKIFFNEIVALRRIYSSHSQETALDQRIQIFLRFRIEDPQF